MARDGPLSGDVYAHTSFTPNEQSIYWNTISD